MNGLFQQPLQIEITISGATVGRIIELFGHVLSHASNRGQSESPPAPTKSGPADDLMIDRLEVAKLLKVHPETVCRMSRSGQMPKPTHFGRAIRWSRKRIEAWVDAGCPPIDSERPEL